MCKNSFILINVKVEEIFFRISNFLLIKCSSWLLLQTSVLDLKEKASSLASSTLKKENRLKSLEINLEQKKEECIKLENQLKKVRGCCPNNERG